jgi:TfoX/Sxy family transcriptional regulator of competence genes
MPEVAASRGSFATLAPTHWLVSGDKERIMAFDEGVAQRLRDFFAERTDIVEKKMFGGIAFMHSGNMCCGVSDDILMARVGPDAYEEALSRPHAREMDFTGKALKGFVYVDSPGFAEDSQLSEWLYMCLAFTQSLPAK